MFSAYLIRDVINWHAQMTYSFCITARLNLLCVQHLDLNSQCFRLELFCFKFTDDELSSFRNV